MREQKVKVFKINELSEEAKQAAYQKWYDRDHYYFWSDENAQSLKEFEKIFPVKISNWNYDRYSYDYHLEMTTERDEINNISGWRLAKYIWNNYRNDIFKPKYLKSLSEKDKLIEHRRVKSKFYENTKVWGNTYYSGLNKDTSCVLTGYYMDNEILDPVYKFLEKPDETTFEDLMRDCAESFFKACVTDHAWSLSMEYFVDEAENNDWEYTEDGREWNYSETENV
jgi:hypothetical protein